LWRESLTSIIEGTLKGIYHEFILRHHVQSVKVDGIQKLIDLETGEILHEFERKRT